MAGNGDAVSAAWTISLDMTPFEDRGTGYNFYDGEVWGEQPYERIENVRTGWPSINHLGDGREVVISHAGIDTPLHMVRRDAGTGTWEDSDLPNYAVLDDGVTTVGNLWPRAAVGGLNDEILHVICISTPIANGGAEYQGQDGALLYYRSMDSGDTWEMQTFPELDSSNFVNISADAYSIHAEGGVVAFAVFNDISDSFIMISDDAGDNWEYHILVDFPIDLYEVDTGLPDSLGYDFDGDGIAQEYFNSDGAGDVHVDVEGNVHCVYGGMYYTDADTTDDGFSYFSGTNGLQYWREDFGPDSSVTIAYAYDIDGSGGLDLEDDIAAYFVNLAGIPSMSSDEDGNLYVSYSAIMEDHSSGLQNFRHVYVVTSQDNGTTWNSENACDLTPDLENAGHENIFASISPATGDSLHVVFMRDMEPGLSIRGDEDPVSLNSIIVLSLSQDEILTCSTPFGCTDSNASNFSPYSLTDDGSCVYPPEVPECSSVCGPGTYWDSELSLCLPTLSADLDTSGCVGMSDLLEMLSQFGACYVPEWSCGDDLNYHGYDYETVLVANDCWFAENLRTERYDNGDLIPSNVPDSALWTSQGAQTFYDLDLPYLEARGRLYNAYAVVDPRGLCPAGWHPASDEDFLTLEALVGLPPSLYDYDGEFGCEVGLAAMFKSEDGWYAGGEGTNALGLNFGATGYHSYGDGYGNFGNGTYWTSTSSDGFHFWRRQFASNDNCLRRSWDNPWVGMGVRCVQDSE